MTRKEISFNGLYADHDFITMKAATGVKTMATASGKAAVEGLAVTVEGNQTAGFGSIGNPLLGIIHKYEDDGFVTIQKGGIAEIATVSSTPAAGDSLVVNGAGLVSGGVGRGIVLSADSTNKKVYAIIG